MSVSPVPAIKAGYWSIRICAISPDFSKILGTFVSISEAARELGIDRKKIVRYIGTNFLIENKEQKFYLDSTTETLNNISKPNVALPKKSTIFYFQFLMGQRSSQKLRECMFMI